MPIRFDNTYARLPESFFASAKPTPVSAPKLIRFNHRLATELGIDADILESPEGLEILSGNGMAEGAEPLAMAYSGHQFGSFSPQLGDGRAILLGEVVREDGIRHDIQLKGAGPTPFSRRGDGRSALGPVLREYIVSEAMAALGVPTTRALAAISTGENVIRDGSVPGGVLTRVAQSHIRIGTFQWFAARRDDVNLKVLADYTIARHYPEVAQVAEPEGNPYLALLEKVIQQQAMLIAHWLQIGFIHGVMNTDNMSVSGETIDFGPCAFMDNYHPMKTFSSIDQQGRYAFANQSSIGHWNLARFAETLLPLIDVDQEVAVGKVEAALDRFAEIHKAELQKRFFAKIGIADGNNEDWKLVERLLTVMVEGEADFTLVFRHLSEALSTSSHGNNDLVGLFNGPFGITEWLVDWQKVFEKRDPVEAVHLMSEFNPIYIPRNHRVEEVIDAAYEGNFKPFHRLVDVLQKPFNVQENLSEYELPPRPEETVHATFCGT